MFSIRAAVAVLAALGSAAAQAQSIHPSAVIGADPDLAADAVIGAGAVLGDGVTVGAGSAVGAGAILGDGVVLGAQVVVGPRARVGAGTTLGDRTAVGRRAVLLSDNVLGDDSALARGTFVGRGNRFSGRVVLGYGARVGDGNEVDELILGNLAQLGGDAPDGATTGRCASLTVGRGALVAVQAPFTFACDDAGGVGVSVGPEAQVEPEATLGGGARVRRGARVGQRAILRTFAAVGRDACVGDSADVGAYAGVRAGARLGDDAVVPVETAVARGAAVDGPAGESAAACGVWPEGDPLGGPPGLDAEGYLVLAPTGPTDPSPGSRPAMPWTTAGPILPTLSGMWNHTCAVNPNGTIQCWGDLGGAGENLGDGTSNGSASAVTVLHIGDTLPAAAAVVGDMDGTCALLVDGSVWCWGQYFGVDQPTAPVGGLTDPVTLFGGGSGHTFFCALERDRTVRCWGDNLFGQLGTGTLGGASAAAVPAVGLTDVVDGARGVGNAGSCVLHATGEVSCWGRGEYGELGFAASTTCYSTPCEPTPTKVPGVAGVAEVVVGHRNTCVRYDDGAVDCWGDNVLGQLSEGGTGGSAGPGGLVQGLVGPAERLGVGTYAGCALIAGTVHCWGLRQGGDGVALSPEPIDAGGPVADLSITDNHSCLRRVDGAILCWGWNGGGTIGDGSEYDDAPIPVPVVGIP